MNNYKVFKSKVKGNFGIKNTASKFKKNKLKIRFQTFEGAQEYCDFIKGREKVNRINPPLKRRPSKRESIHAFLNLTLFKPVNL